MIYGETKRNLGIAVPARTQLCPYIFEIGIPHVVHAKNVEVGVFRDAFTNVGVEF